MQVEWLRERVENLSRELVLARKDSGRLAKQLKVIPLALLYTPSSKHDSCASPSVQPLMQMSWLSQPPPMQNAVDLSIGAHRDQTMMNVVHVLHPF